MVLVHISTIRTRLASGASPAGFPSAHVRCSEASNSNNNNNNSSNDNNGNN